MTISFNQIPNGQLTPFVFVEFDNSHANQGPAIQNYKALIIGQRLPSGTVHKGVPTRVTGEEQAAEYFGRASMLHHMVSGFLDNNRVTELWVIALDDDQAGAQATYDMTITGLATQAGTFNLMVGGHRLRVAVSIGDQAAAVASKIAAAVSKDTDITVTASATAEKVTFTALHKGEVGNGIDVRCNYYSGEDFPAGISATRHGLLAGGTGNPTLTDTIAAMGDEAYHIIAMPYTDQANLVEMETELASRWGPGRQLDGHALTASNGTHSELGTLGDSRNSEHLTISGYYGVPTLAWKCAAADAAVVALHGQIDPARPFQTLPLAGVQAPWPEDRFTREERNLLLNDGISTKTVSPGGEMLIERMVTTYNLNAQGAPDPSYRDVNTLLTLSYLRFDFRAYITNKYPRHKLAGDTVRVPAGQAIMTPSIGKAEAVAKFMQWQDMGLVENLDQFKRDLVVERDAQDPNRLNWLLPPDLINQLRVNAAQVQFRV
ncbi:phage tail sheath subtilisin-like domain-containing protein [Sansalvadorimonas verongulae]|uniref:phage tail sheath subtilisin-like domain-containing protein n=1 Tax=Sansalvadorimonas verongulae TaxID=2172824 RepID=UPI0012BBBD13|nr:phage tail sheath subtilisin-like domain-containing protein [Sansalvadorimonas verongulae]MTI13362.1 phage tail protein [Sansalvadorimonas verongulae]